jgi:KamA family protein
MSTSSAGAGQQLTLVPDRSYSAPEQPRPTSRAIAMNFLEGTRIVTLDELRTNDITRYQVTKFYQDQIQKSGYYEQLKYIVEPSFKEFESPGALDTSGEADNTVVPGLQHKYPQTGLLLVTDRCAAYCRYCFRKRIVGNDSDEVAPDYARVADYIRAHPEMQNVLLSGGDSMILSTEKLHRIMDHLLPLANLTSIRFGTKTIAFYPPRFADPELPAFFERIIAAGKTPVIVTHFDHLGEISDEAVKNIQTLRKHGVQFLNQTVLLNGVNNDPEIIAKTFARLHDIGVRPYYLFQGRPVKAASHFQVPLSEGVEIVRGVNARLSGIQKTFKYIMSHVTGKIEILDLTDGRLYMRYHQNKIASKIGRMFSRPHVEGACWLDDLPQA